MKIQNATMAAIRFVDGENQATGGWVFFDLEAECAAPLTSKNECY